MVISFGSLSECTNVESDADCEYWMSIGECTGNSDWMMANCRKTCWGCAGASKSLPCDIITEFSYVENS